MIERHRSGFSAAGVTAFAVLAVTFSIFAWFYRTLRYGFSDDVFISLHIARNGADHLTWQYFTLVNRAALLASSPLKILLLTIAAKSGAILGFSARTFPNAKLILVLYAPLAWVIWYPFWKGRGAAFAWLGTVYFCCALCLDAAVDFEGGLLFCWGATLVLLLGEPEKRIKELGWVIPLGFLIRPDAALPVIAATAVILGFKLLAPVFVSILKRGTALFVLWCAVCWMMKVWPIPVTYWAKASLPTLVDERYMIELFFERLGWVSGGRFLNSPQAATLLGALFVLCFILAIVRDGRDRLAAFAAVVTSGMLLIRIPSSFWWYYQNDIMVFVGIAVGQLARHRFSDIFSSSKIRPIGAFVLAAMLMLLVGKGFMDGPTSWRVDAPSRAQAYAYLASKAVGDGSYGLPGIGTVFIKNPEIGMTSYFSGEKAWIWDSGGLAQPLVEPHVQTSLLRYFFPPRLREPALTDARDLASRSGKGVRVEEVWGMDDRNFAAARQKCRYVIEEAAVCGNDFLDQSKPAQ